MLLFFESEVNSVFLGFGKIKRVKFSSKETKLKIT